MPNLHVHYYHGNVKAFRQELDGTQAATGHDRSRNHAGGAAGGGGGSLGKSWTGLGVMSGNTGKADPNERDAFGRTVSHSAAGTSTQQAYSFFSILLRNPDIRVNLQDYESGYTASHRALFAGNIRVARDSSARNDIDLSVKDAEGSTAFDSYNGTVDGTNPVRGDQGSDLYVWGVNRNFTLGTGDSSDKAFPDRVNSLTQNQASEHPDPAQRFYHVGVHDVAMSKLHTGVITSEARGNSSMCGFGSNGRLGRSVHSQSALLPMPDLPHTIVSIASGQDHTLALTSGGYILSWGHNRFFQLGYVFDQPENPIHGRIKDEDQVQVSPRRIVGPLKKEWVRGVAAGRMSSACWTAESVWTWGTNAGHSGYDKASNPVQVVPRKVTAITQPVIDVAISDYAMICLVDSFEVVCFHHDANFRITFSTPRILSDAFPFRPPQATLKPMIEKVTSSGQTFAALSSIGDVFTFSLPNPLEDISKDARDRHVTVKPQLIWASRKSFTAVKDVASGSDGTVIICTHSGHVFVRQRVKSGSGLKFRRIPYIQRAIKVACNESGAFAAVRVDAKATPIPLIGRTLEEDSALLQPHYRRFENQMTAEDFESRAAARAEDEEDEDEGSNSVHKDLSSANRLCTILRRWRNDTTDTSFAWSAPLSGSDSHLVVGETAIPAHRTILALRIPLVTKIIKGTKSDRVSYTDLDGPKLTLDVCHPLVALLLSQYVYADDVTAIWDPRVARAIQTRFADLDLPIAQIKADLRSLADSFGLTPLSTVSESASKVQIPQKSLSTNLRTFFTSTYANSATGGACDVVIRSADKEVSCSSVISRARCPFFEAMFADRDWTTERLDQGSVVVDMTHSRWRPMRMVFRFIHEGLEDDLFDYSHQETLDEFLDFVFEVLAAATELLLDRSVLVCSRVIIRHCNVYNAAALACEASFYQATTLKLSIFDYIVSSMETMLESGLLDEMYEDVLSDLCQHIGRKQLKKSSVSRSGELVNGMMEKWKDWLASQDIPAPRVRQAWRWKPRSPVISPVDFTTGPSKEKRRKTPSPVLSPELRPVTATSNGHDDIFAMDDDIPTPPSTGYAMQTPRSSRPVTPFDLSGGSASKAPVWKSRAVEAEKVDSRSVMAEAAASKTPARSPMLGPVSGRTPTTDRRPPLPSSISTPSKSPSSARSPPSGGPSSGANGPWRAMDRTKSSSSAVQLAQASTQQTKMSRATGSQASPVTQATQARVINPVKLQPAPAGAQRKASSGAAWTTSSAFAPVAPVASSSPDARSFSLLAIQQQEQDFAERSKRPQTKSFAEIQEEERKAEIARAEEQEFMRWWEEEQARVAGEQGGPPTGGAGGATRGGRGRGRGRGAERGRKVPPQGRGRGRGGGPGGGAPAGGGRADPATGSGAPGASNGPGQGKKKKQDAKVPPT